MAFHIVTSKCFLVCEKVISVVVEELAPDGLAKRAYTTAKKKNKKTKKTLRVKKPELTYSIAISYYPLASNNHGGSIRDEHSLEVRVTNKEEAAKLYKEIIKEVQEQHPNEGYLDTLVDRVLLGIESELKDEK